MKYFFKKIVCFYKVCAVDLELLLENPLKRSETLMGILKEFGTLAGLPDLKLILQLAV